MKSLKRTLSLVLALVMVLGLFGGISMTAAASDFKDDTEIQYKEAVDVMTGIGAIDGYEEADGNSFKPTGTITRAEAAKLVAYTVLGKGAAERLPAGVSSRFTDVGSEYDWAAPSIEYLVDRGIINGMGDGTFHPGEPITGYAIGKMLLCALGWGQKGEYTGDAWQLQTAIDGAKVGSSVFAGRAADANHLSQNATREEVALYCFNTIQQPMVEYYSVLDVYRAKTTFEPGGSNGTQEVTIKMMDEIYPTLESVPNDDAVGRPTKTWIYSNKQIHQHAIKPVLTYTGAVESTKITKDLKALGLEIPGNPTEPFVLYNNVLASSDGTAPASGSISHAISNASGIAALTQYEDTDKIPRTGLVTEFYCLDTDSVIDKVVMVETELDFITSIDEDDGTLTLASGKSADKYTDGYKAVYAAASALMASGVKQVPITVVREGELDTYNVTAAANTMGGSGDVLSLGIPQTETAKVTKVIRVPADYAVSSIQDEVLSFIAGGKEYTVSFTAEQDNPVLGLRYVVDNNKGNLGNEVNIFTDENGFVIGATKVDAEPPTVGLLLAAGNETSVFDGNTVKIKVLTATGEEVTLTVSQVDLETGTYSPATNATQFNGHIGHVVSYVADTGANTGKFKVAEATASSKTFTDKDIATGKSNIAAGIDGNDDTVYVVMDKVYKADGSGTAWTVANSSINIASGYTTDIYTGVKNVPNMEGASGSAYIWNKLASVVYVITNDGAAVENLSALVMDNQHVVHIGTEAYYQGALMEGSGAEKKTDVYVPIDEMKGLNKALYDGTVTGNKPTALGAISDGGTKAEYKYTITFTADLSSNDSLTFKYDETTFGPYTEGKDSITNLSSVATKLAAAMNADATISADWAVTVAKDASGDKLNFTFTAINGKEGVVGSGHGPSKAPAVIEATPGSGNTIAVDSTAPATLNNSIPGVDPADKCTVNMSSLNENAILAEAKENASLTSGEISVRYETDKLKLFVGNTAIGNGGAYDVTSTGVEFTGINTGASLGKIVISDTKTTAATEWTLAADIQTGLIYTKATATAVAATAGQIPVYLLNSYDLEKDTNGHTLLTGLEIFKNTDATTAHAGTVQATAKKSVIELKDGNKGLDATHTEGHFTYSDKCVVWEITLHADGTFKVSPKNSVESVVSSTAKTLALWTRTEKLENITSLYTIKVDDAWSSDKTAIMQNLDSYFIG